MAPVSVILCCVNVTDALYWKIFKIVVVQGGAKLNYIIMYTVGLLNPHYNNTLCLITCKIFICGSGVKSSIFCSGM